MAFAAIPFLEHGGGGGPTTGLQLAGPNLWLLVRRQVSEVEGCIKPHRCKWWSDEIRNGYEMVWIQRRTKVTQEIREANFVRYKFAAKFT